MEQVVDTTKSDKGKRGTPSALHRLVEGLTFFIGVTATLLLQLIFFSTGGVDKRLFFVYVLCVLVGTFLGIVVYAGSTNQEVINLKKRLAEIYLTALKKSALNPQLRSSTLNE